ncbi:MAG: methyltransferase [Candidatus Acidiferrales bacterium]
MNREWLARWRVRLGYPLAIVVFWFARPTPHSLAWGASIGIAGLLVRGLAAGTLKKHEALTVTGPYAYTRNPLYLGSTALAAGFAAACHSWYAAAVLAAYFVCFYPGVMGREERELRAHYGASFEKYAARVPLFFPRFTAARFAEPDGQGFSWKQYAKNREYRAAAGLVLVLGILYGLMRWRGR